MNIAPTPTFTHEFNAEGARILANGIRNNTTLSELNLDQLLDITKHGWMAIFDALQRSTCRLDMLSLESNYFLDDDNVARSMSLAILHHNSTLKTLRLGNNRSITVVAGLPSSSICGNPIACWRHLVDEFR